MNIAPLVWKDWNKVQSYRSWDQNLDMRETEPTPFGEYKLLRRYKWAGSKVENEGKWFVQRPGARPLGPFDTDVDAKRAADVDWNERVTLCQKQACAA